MKKNFLFEQYLYDNELIEKKSVLELIHTKISKTPSFFEIAHKKKYLDEEKLFELINYAKYLSSLSVDDVALKKGYLTQDQIKCINDEMDSSVPDSKKLCLEKDLLTVDKFESIEQDVKKLEVDLIKRIETLKKIELFSGLTENELYDLSLIANELAFDEGEIVIKEDEDAEDFYCLIDGSVKITKKNIQEPENPDIFLTTIDAPEIFGESSIFEEEKRTANVIAESKLIVYRFSRDRFVNYLENHHGASLNVLSVTIKRLLNKISATNRELAFERRNFMDQGNIDDLLDKML